MSLSKKNIEKRFSLFKNPGNKKRKALLMNENEHALLNSMKSRKTLRANNYEMYKNHLAPKKLKAYNEGFSRLVLKKNKNGENVYVNQNNPNLNQENLLHKKFGLNKLLQVEMAVNNNTLNNMKKDLDNILLNVIDTEFNNKVVHMGTTDIVQTSNTRYKTLKNFNLNMKNKPLYYTFLISMDILGGAGGHWCGGVFDVKNQFAYIFDSMQAENNGRSVYTPVFSQVVMDTFNIQQNQVHVSGCPGSKCNIRNPLVHSRQREGGFSGPRGNKLLGNVSKYWTQNDRRYMSKYGLQHHFCYGEALMYICEKLLTLFSKSKKTWVGFNHSNKCTSLFVIKRFLFMMFSKYSNIKIPNDFKLVFNFDKNQARQIMSDLNASTSERMSLINIINTAYKRPIMS